MPRCVGHNLPIRARDPQSRTLAPSNEREIDNNNGQRRSTVICIFSDMLHPPEASECNADEVAKMDPHCPGSDPCHPQSLLGPANIEVYFMGCLECVSSAAGRDAE